jgi:hypothetical protein
MTDIFNADKQEEVLKGLALQEQEEAKQRRINFGLTFSTREGFEVLKDLLTLCHPLATSYVPTNQFETAFREGERNVFLYILSQLSDELKSKIIGGL